MKGNNEVAVIDASDNLVNQDVSVGTGAQPVAVAVSPDGNYAYVADMGNNTVAVLQNNFVDTSNNVDIASVSLPSGSQPDAIAVDPTGDRVLVADKGTGELSVIDSNPKDGSNYCTGSLYRLPRRPRHEQLDDETELHRLLFRRRLRLRHRRR